MTKRREVLNRGGGTSWLTDYTHLGDVDAEFVQQRRGRKGLKHLTGEQQDALHKEARALNWAIKHSDMSVEEASEWLELADRTEGN